MKRTLKKRILIIEDEPDVITYLSTILEDHGYEVEISVDGDEAMKKVNEMKPDLISLDISLPAKTGVNIYCELKADPNLSSIPVVMVTGIQKEFERYIHTHNDLPPPDGYICKPFIVEDLLTVFSNLLDKNQEEHMYVENHE